MRREKGTGSITKLSGNRRKPYCARVTLGYDENGKQKVVSIGCFKTKKEAAQALSNYSKDNINDLFNISFGKLFELFSEEHYPRVSESTRKGYNLAFKYCLPLHKKKFREIKLVDLQRLVNGLQLKVSSKKLVQAFLKMMYNHAIKNDIVIKNYAQFIEVGKVEVTEKEIFTDEEIQKYFDLADDDIAKTVLCLIYSGLRIQEFEKLTVDNIDLTQRIIKGGLKTEAGKNRTVPLHPKTYDFWVGFALGAKNGKIFPFCHSQYFRLKLTEFQKKNGLPRRTPHAARHTCATLLARSGVDPVYIKQILGHSNYAFTVNRYTHSNTEELHDALSLM